MENLFLPIDDLIFAPVNAIKEADIALSNGILKQIATFCIPEDGQNNVPVMKLKNIKFLYERAKSDEDGEKIETMGLTVPAASIIPLSALQISHSAIQFSIELKSGCEKDGTLSLLGKPAPKRRRKTDFLPKMSFRIQTERAPLPEGVARLVDVLDISQIPSVEDKTYVDSDGIPLENQELYAAKREAVSAIRRLDAIIGKIDQALVPEHQEACSSTEASEDKPSKQTADLAKRREQYACLKKKWEQTLLDTEIQILEETIRHGA